MNEDTDRCVWNFAAGCLVPDTHQNDFCYVRELSGPTFDYLCKNLAWCVVTRRTSKKLHKTVKIRGWVISQDNMVY